MFGAYNIDAMNETDVREIIVRPLLHELGYRQGTDATIRTEITYRYGRAFLGRKDPANDPDLRDLRGRADYICDVVSFGRLVVEVKGPGEPLTLETSQQAHTYAAHPEVAAVLYLVTNGRHFRVYRTSYPDEPIFEWPTEETEANLVAIRNLLSPEAIKRRVHIPLDRGKPLAAGLSSKVRIAGGSLVYGAHSSDVPQFQQQLSAMEGLRAAITGGSAYRNETGQIVAEVEQAGPYSQFDAFNKAAGIDVMLYRTSSEYISTDVNNPTIFQNSVTASVPRGTVLQMPGMPRVPSPFEIALSAETEALGYIEGRTFRGVFSIAYRLVTIDAPVMFRQVLPPKFEFTGEGEFSLNFVDD